MIHSQYIIPVQPSSIISFLVMILAYYFMFSQRMTRNNIRASDNLNNEQRVYKMQKMRMKNPEYLTEMSQKQHAGKEKCRFGRFLL